jgi:hypothetical protein
MRPSRYFETADNFHPATPHRITEEEYLICFAAKDCDLSHDISGLSVNTNTAKKISAYSVEGEYMPNYTRSHPGFSGLQKDFVLIVEINYSRQSMLLARTHTLH